MLNKGNGLIMEDETTLNIINTNASNLMMEPNQASNKLIQIQQTTISDLEHVNEIP